LVVSWTAGAVACDLEGVHGVVIQARRRRALKDLRRLRTAIHLWRVKLVIQEARRALLLSHLLLLCLLLLLLALRNKTLALVVWLTIRDVCE
jgi:hypothetical protein